MLVVCRNPHNLYNHTYGVRAVSLPLLKPLLLTVGATSLVFFGGVIALAVQSPEPVDSLSAFIPSLVTQDMSIASDIASVAPVDALSAQPSMAILTAAQAGELAKQAMPNALLQATPELVNYNGTIAYEVQLDRGVSYIDANLGAILNPVTNENYRTESLDNEYDDDDGYDDDDDEGYDDDEGDDYKKENNSLIVTSYRHYEDDHDDD